MAEVETTSTGSPGNEGNDASSEVTEKAESVTNEQSVNGISKMNIDYDDDDALLTCGWLGLRPDWMQRRRSPGWLASAISSLMFVQGIVVNGFVFINLSTVETRFGLTSTSTGLLVSAYDLTVVVLIIFVSYFGATRNKARMLGIGSFIIGFGSLLWALPHFTTGLYEYDAAYGDSDTLCRPGENITDGVDCEEEWQSLAYYWFVFLFAQILLGIGASPVYTVGYAYMDENVGHRTSSWYTGILSAFSILGPCTGFLLGAFFLGIYTDIRVADEVTITPEDPSWVGAWWLGFLLGWILAWIVAPVMGAFPPALPGQKEIQKERQSQAHFSESAESTVTRAGFGEGWRDLWPATKILLKNPPFVFICLTKAMLMFIIGGFTPFIPKFLENQFGLTSSAAALLLGATSIPGAAGGTLIGGWVLKKYNLKVKGMLKFSIGIGLVTLCLTPIFMLRCPENQVAGVVTPYDPTEEGRPDPVNLTHACNADCQCAGTETYQPVCGANDLVYFDACYAGCRNTPDSGETYYNCSCIYTDDSDSPEAESGYCTADCWQLPVFTVFFFLLMLLGFMLLAPNTVLSLRCVPDSQRSYGLGIASIIYRLCGSVPGPIIIGAVVDSSCIVWQEICGERGSCWIYDNFMFALKFFILGFSGFLLTILLLIATLFVYKPPPEEATEDENTQAAENGETEPKDGVTSPPAERTMEEETKMATIQRETSTISLLGYIKRDPDETVLVN